MIIKALSEYYDALYSQGKLPRNGWAYTGISYTLWLNKDGSLKNVVPLETEYELKNGDKRMIRQTFVLPLATVRSRGLATQPLWDNCKYILGIGDKNGKLQKEYFDYSRDFYNTLLKDAVGDYGIAIRNFFNTWDIEKVSDNSILQPYLKDILSMNKTFIFTIDGKSYAQDDPELIKIYDDYFVNLKFEGEMRCSSTGEVKLIVANHYKIKGLIGQDTAGGGTFISFNNKNTESYGKKGYLNAPISQESVFKYTTALNYLLKGFEHQTKFNSYSVVHWAENDNKFCTNFIDTVLFGTKKDVISDENLKNIIQQARNGTTVTLNKDVVSLKNKFYILGLAPNSARIVTRFFWQKEFGDLLHNLDLNQQQLDIVKPEYIENPSAYVSIYSMMRETVNTKIKDKPASPLVEIETTNAVLNATKYPMILYNGVLRRIHAEQGDYKISYRRVAIIKAFLLRNYNLGGIATVSLNEETNDKAYVLGRLFATYEHVQFRALGKKNCSIKDRYFNGASTTPEKVFPKLQKLYQAHSKVLMKACPGYAIKNSKLITALYGKLSLDKELFPKHLTASQQGLFILGYYHQMAVFYEKHAPEKTDIKNKTNNEEND